MRLRLLFLVMLIGSVLQGCGVAEQPTGNTTNTPISSSNDLANTPNSQANWIFRTAQAQIRAQRQETARAQIASPPTPDLRPTPISSLLQALPGGGYLNTTLHGAFKHPRLTQAWILDLPDKRQLVVYAGGYQYPIDNYGGQELLKPELGAYSVKVYQPAKPGSPTQAPLDRSDPRNTNGTLPVRDGMARIVDALVTNDRIMVTLRTDSSAYTYEVNSGTLAPAQPPTVTLGGPYRVQAGAVLGLEAQGQDAAGTQFDYAWDLDGDGTFETKGQHAVFSAKELSSPQQRSVRVQVTAHSGLSATAETTISIDN